MVASTRLSFFVALCILLVSDRSNGQQVAVQSREDVRSVIDGLASRSGVLYSGRVHFVHRTEYSPADDQAHDSDAKEYDLAFRGDDWALRLPGMTNTVINRDGFLATYTPRAVIPAPGSASAKREQKSIVRMEAGEKLLSQSSSQEWRMVIRLGAFLFPEMTDFVSRNIESCEDRNVATIGGIHCRVLAWKVVPNDYDEAFIRIPNVIANQGGGKLVAYVASDLGYAIPRYEYESVSGEVGMRVEASDFREVDDGLFFPYAASVTVFHGRGKSQAGIFEVKSFSSANGTIDDSVFDIEFSDGTKVRDSRPGRPMHTYTAGSGLSLADVAKDTVAAVSPRITWNSIVVVNLVLLLGVAIAVVVRAIRLRGFSQP